MTGLHAVRYFIAKEAASACARVGQDEQPCAHDTLWVIGQWVMVADSCVRGAWVKCPSSTGPALGCFKEHIQSNDTAVHSR